MKVFNNRKKIDYTQVRHRKEALAAIELEKVQKMVLGSPSDDAAIIDAGAVPVAEEIEEDDDLDF